MHADDVERAGAKIAPAATNSESRPDGVAVDSRHRADLEKHAIKVGLINPE